MPQAYIIARKCDIISKIYHPFRQERISLKTTSFVCMTKEVLSNGVSDGIRTHDLQGHNLAL